MEDCEGGEPWMGFECIGTGAGSRLTWLADSDLGIAIRSMDAA